MKRLKHLVLVVGITLVGCGNIKDMAPAEGEVIIASEVQEVNEVKPYMLEEGYDLISSGHRKQEEFKRHEVIRIAEEKAAEELRIAEEKKAEEARVAEEKAAAERVVAENKIAEEKVVAQSKEKAVSDNKASSETGSTKPSSTPSKPAEKKAEPTPTAPAQKAKAAPVAKETPKAAPVVPTSAQGQLVVKGQSFYPKSVDRFNIQGVIDAGHVSYSNMNGTKMFFGHNPGIFKNITGVKVGDIISYSGRNYKISDKVTDTYDRMDSGATRLGGMELYEVAMNGAAGDAIYLQFCEGAYMTGVLAYPAQ